MHYFQFLDRVGAFFDKIAMFFFKKAQKEEEKLLGVNFKHTKLNEISFEFGNSPAGNNQKKIVELWEESE